MDFEDLYRERDKFRDKIIAIIGNDLNGYVLEDAAIDYLEQTPVSQSGQQQASSMPQGIAQDHRTDCHASISAPYELEFVMSRCRSKRKTLIAQEMILDTGTSAGRCRSPPET